LFEHFTVLRPSHGHTCNQHGYIEFDAIVDDWNSKRLLQKRNERETQRHVTYVAWGGGVFTSALAMHTVAEAQQSFQAENAMTNDKADISSHFCSSATNFARSV
jgi:hypothetical protein